MSSLSVDWHVGNVYVLSWNAASNLSLIEVCSVHGEFRNVLQDPFPSQRTASLTVQPSHGFVTENVHSPFTSYDNIQYKNHEGMQLSDECSGASTALQVASGKLTWI